MDTLAIFSATSVNGDNLVTSCLLHVYLSFFGKGVYPKWTECATSGNEFFLKRVDHFSEMTNSFDSYLLWKCIDFPYAVGAG